MEDTMEDIKILIADDEPEILKLLQRYIEKEGYSVDTASDGLEAISLFNQNEYHLVILDIMMPQIDGIEVCRRLRNDTNVPIIMLTAKDDEIDKVLGLRIGADDYMTKPFGMNELMARVNAHLRRYLVLSGGSNLTNKNILEFNNLKIDLKSYMVYRGKELLNLTAKEFELLKFFASHPNQVFTKAQIFKYVWGDEYIEDDNTVMVHIRRLRKKIEVNPEKPQFIQTVWGIGYKFVGE
jgi:DNA-binding response OmpR family regulator